MKRRSIFAVTVAAIVATVGYFGYSNRQDNFSDIQLANIEALSFGEFIPGLGWECYGVVFEDATNSWAVKVKDCSTCNEVSVVYCNNSSYCTNTEMYGM